MSLLENYKPEPMPDEAELLKAAAEPQAEETGGLADLIDVYETVSEEAFVVGDLNNYLQRKSAKISAAIRDNFRTLTTWNFKRPEVINVQPLARALNTRDYTDLCELSVYVPVGFNGELLEYATLLTNQSQPLASGILVNMLLPAQKCFAYYINSPGETQDRRELVIKPKFTLGQLDAVIKAEAKFLIAGNHRSTSLLCDVFENKNAIVSTADLLNKLNHTLWQQVTPEKVKEETDKLVKVSTVLFGLLENSDNKTSPVFLKSLMGQLVEVGKFVEWYSTLMARLADFTSAMKLNEKTLLDLKA